MYVERWPIGDRRGSAALPAADRTFCAQAMVPFCYKTAPVTVPKQPLPISMTLSGSTVFAADGILPQRNLPIVDVFSGGTEDHGTLADCIARGRRLHDGGRAAVSFRGPEHASRQQVVQIARELRQALALGAVVLVEGDFAKALGQQLAVLGLRQVVVLDGVSVGRGDYIDIGRPVGDAVPVVVKTIAFR